MRDKKPICRATMPGIADPSHTHTCTGDHNNGDHFCAECKRWWYQAKKEKAS